MNSKKPLHILSVILYILAATMLLAAIYILFYSFGFIRNAGESLQILLTNFGPVAGMLVDLLRNAISTISTLFVVLTFLVSALLFTAAQITVRFSELRGKVDDLESKVNELEKSK